jgi:CheY-like chemotaxis protein/HPt (histidine-containing phosphotransfer) domain-containing protein
MSIDKLNATINIILEAAASLRQGPNTPGQESSIQQIQLAAAKLKTELSHLYPTATKKESLKGKHVLLVEDEEIIRSIGNNMLVRNGATVTLAVDGKQATELTAIHKYDIILLDIQMPVMDGFTAATIMRQQQKIATPIIALTANSIADPTKYTEAGMNETLNKPYNDAQLLATIARLFGTKQREATAPAIEKPREYSIEKLQASGDENFTKRMLQLFVQEVPTSVDNIWRAYNSGDLQTVQYLMHRIRPSILNMGIESLRAEATEIEVLASGGQKDATLEQMIKKLQAVISNVADDVSEKYLNKAADL